MVSRVWMIIFCAIVLVIAPGSSLPVNDVAVNTAAVTPVTAKIDQSNGKIDKSKDNDTLSNDLKEFIKKVEKVITDIYFDDSNTTLRKFAENLTEAIIFEEGMTIKPFNKSVLKFQVIEVVEDLLKEMKYEGNLDELLGTLHNPFINEVLKSEFKIINILSKIQKFILTKDNVTSISNCEIVEKIYNKTDFPLIKTIVKNMLSIACSDNSTKSNTDIVPFKLIDKYFTLVVFDIIGKLYLLSNTSESTVANISLKTEKIGEKREEKQTHSIKKRSRTNRIERAAFNYNFPLDNYQKQDQKQKFVLKKFNNFDPTFQFPHSVREIYPPYFQQKNFAMKPKNEKILILLAENNGFDPTLEIFSKTVQNMGHMEPIPHPYQPDWDQMTSFDNPGVEVSENIGSRLQQNFIMESRALENPQVPPSSEIHRYVPYPPFLG